MIGIVGRLDIQERFDTILKSKQAEFVAMYGRRRVGKTYIIREYFKHQIVIDFSGAYSAPNSVQLQNFHNEFLTTSTSKSIIKPPKNWTQAFRNLSDFLNEEKAKHDKIVVFIDEMPWLDQPKSGFVSALEYFWNQKGSKIKNLILITCGSSATWIIQNLIRAKGGLYNRITHQIELKPFTLKEIKLYAEAKQFRFTNYQIVQLYMVLGGIPFYWNMVPQGKSVPQVIDVLYFGPNAQLAKEFKPLFHSLFKNAEQHIQIVEALSRHPYGLDRAQLELQTDIPAGGSLARAIENLADSGFLLNIKFYGNKNKNSIFRLTDFFSHFYLKFVRNMPSGRVHTWQSIHSSPALNSWLGYSYENIFYCHLDQLHRSLGIWGVFTTIHYWHSSGNKVNEGSQIDLIIERNDGIIHLCEAKFSSKEFVLTKAYTAQLRKRRALFEDVANKKRLIVTTLLTSFPAIKNEYYLEEIHTEVNMDALFQ